MRLHRPLPAERRSTSPRRPHLIGRPAPAVPSVAPNAAHTDPHLLAERRHRASGASEDRALYLCGCGTGFTATVTTTVGCPMCGSGQAW
jgi:hypothetical protein